MRRRRRRSAVSTVVRGCHGATLTGGTAPPLTGPAFEASWSNPRVTLADLFFIAPHDDAAARVELVVGAGSRRGVRLHPEGRTDFRSGRDAA